MHTYIRRYKKRGGEDRAGFPVVSVKYLPAWSRCVRPIKQNPIKRFVLDTFFHHVAHADRACALIDLPSNGSEPVAALSPGLCPGAVRSKTIIDQ